MPGAGRGHCVALAYSLNGGNAQEKVANWKSAIDGGYILEWDPMLKVAAETVCEESAAFHEVWCYAKQLNRLEELSY